MREESPFWGGGVQPCSERPVPTWRPRQPARPVPAWRPRHSELLRPLLDPAGSRSRGPRRPPRRPLLGPWAAGGGARGARRGPPPRGTGQWGGGGPGARRRTAGPGGPAGWEDGGGSPGRRRRRRRTGPGRPGCAVRSRGRAMSALPSSARAAEPARAPRHGAARGLFRAGGVRAAPAR